MESPNSQRPTKKTQASKVLKGLMINDQLTFIPPKLMGYSVTMRSSNYILPPLPFSNGNQSLNTTKASVEKIPRKSVDTKKKIKEQINSSQTELLNLELGSKTIFADNVLQRDRSLDHIDFTKKQRDVSYLMETNKYVKEKPLNRYVRGKINNSTQLMSSDAHESMMAKSFRSNNSKDNSVIIPKGKDNIYNKMLNHGSSPADAFPTDLDEVKGLLVHEGIEVTNRLSRNPSEIGIANSIPEERISFTIPKMIDAYKVGYGPDAYTEVRDTELKGSLQKAREKKLSEHRAQNKNLHIPSGRMEVLSLSDWLNKMLEKIQNQNNLRVTEIFEHVQVIYTMCLKEIIRQVGLQCTERGQLLDKIWGAYMDLLDKAINENSNEKMKIENYYLDEIAALHSMYQKQLEFQILNFENIKKERDEQISLLTTQSEQLKYLKKKTKKLNLEVHKGKKEIDDLKNRIEDLLVDNGEMKVVIEAAGLSFQTKIMHNKGNLKKRGQRKQKKDEKKEMFLEIFDSNKDFNLFENLNMIDKLEEELDQQEAQDKNNVIENDSDVDDLEELYREVGVNTEVVEVVKLEKEIQTVKKSHQDMETQCDPIEEKSAGKVKKTRIMKSRTRTKEMDGSPTAGSLHEILGADDDFRKDEALDNSRAYHDLDNVEETAIGDVLEEVKREEKKEEVVEVVEEKKIKIGEKDIARMTNKLVGQLKKQGAELKAARAQGNTGNVNPENPAGEGVIGDAQRVIEKKDLLPPVTESVSVKEENLNEKPKEEVLEEKKEESLAEEKKIKIGEKDIARMTNKLVGQLKKQGAELKAARALTNVESVNPAGENVIDNKDSSLQIAETVPVKDEAKEEVIEEKKEEIVEEKKVNIGEKDIARMTNKLVGQLKKQGAELKAAKALANVESVNPAGEGVTDNKNLSQIVALKEENLNEKPKEEVVEERKEEVVEEKKVKIGEKDIARMTNKLVGQLKKQGAELKAVRAFNAAVSEKNGNEE